MAGSQRHLTFRPQSSSLESLKAFPFTHPLTQVSITCGADHIGLQKLAKSVKQQKKPRFGNRI